MKNNRWFVLYDIAMFNGEHFSCLTSTNQCKVKYDVLELGFKIMTELQWFSYSWRRREGEDISYMSANIDILVSFDEIEKLPVFKDIIDENRISKGKKIEIFIQQNNDIKIALMEKYGKQLGIQLYTSKNNQVTYVKSDRYCDRNKILQTLKASHPDDDFTEIDNILILNCIINAY